MRRWRNDDIKMMKNGKETYCRVFALATSERLSRDAWAFIEAHLGLSLSSATRSINLFMFIISLNSVVSSRLTWLYVWSTLKNRNLLLFPPQTFKQWEIHVWWQMTIWQGTGSLNSVKYMKHRLIHTTIHSYITIQQYVQSTGVNCEVQIYLYVILSELTLYFIHHSFYRLCNLLVSIYLNDCWR